MPTVGAVFKSVPPVLSVIVQATSRSEAEWTVRTWSSCVANANSRPTALWIINKITAPLLVDLSIFRPTSLFSLSFYTFIKLLQHISPPPPPPHLLRKLKATLQTAGHSSHRNCRKHNKTKSRHTWKLRNIDQYNGKINPASKHLVMKASSGIKVRLHVFLTY